MIRLKSGIVSKILYDDAEIQEIFVLADEKDAPAINYIVFTGRVVEGDTVIINTTATQLGLGTGGCDFVVCNISRDGEYETTGPGHIMKLRYTPLQHSVLSVEEDNSPYRQKIMDFKDLNGTYVIICPLHSMMAITAAALKYLNGYKIVYIMTDAGSLPISFSKTVRELKGKHLIDATITIGQAFGGDFEAVNIYTGLITAKEVCSADVILVSMGPGITGTGTKYGFSGTDEGHIIDAVNDFKGNPIYIPRISFADERERHTGISHHSMTSLKELCHTHCDIILPEMDELSSEMIQEQIHTLESAGRYNFHVENGEFISHVMDVFGLNIRTMGRVYDDDPYFYQTCAAAAKFVAENICRK